MKSRASINSCTYEFKIRNGYLNELERVKKKLAGWKANLLSLASRAILIQASTTTIPAYVMQCTALPKKLLDNLDRVNRNFLWGSTDDAKKVH